MVLLILVSSAILASSCSGSGNAGTNPTGPGTNEVWIHGNAYDPDTLTISPGTTVTWTNKDGYAHTVTSDVAGLFNSGNMPYGGHFTHTFDSTGTYLYHCNIHPTMHGIIHVSQSAPGAHQVWMQNNEFIPASLTISAGDTLTFINQDTTVHKIESGTSGNFNGLFISNDIQPNQSWVHAFDSTGTFPYFDPYHLPNMVGTVIVQ